MKILETFIKKICLKINNLFQSDMLNPFNNLEHYHPSENLLRNIKNELKISDS